MNIEVESSVKFFTTKISLNFHIPALISAIQVPLVMFFTK